MASIEEIKKLQSHEVTAVIGWFLATVAPGFLIIFIYNPSLIKELDTVKLIVLSLSVTLPLIAVNISLFVILRVFFKFFKDANRNEFFFLQMVWAFLVIYGAVWIAYLFNLNIKQLMLCAVLLDGVLLIFICVLGWKLKSATP